MATYYRWRKSTISYGLTKLDTFYSDDFKVSNTGISINYSSSIKYSENEIELVSPNYTRLDVGDDLQLSNNTYFMISVTSGIEVYRADDHIRLYFSGSALEVINGSFSLYEMKTSPGTSQGYVYSTSSSAYPNGGVSGDYYYDQRTTVTSPTAPTGLTYPNPITTPSAAISWTAATSATNYPVSLYEVSYSTNGGSSWTVAGTTAEVNYSFDITPGTTSIMFRVRAQDSNGQWGDYMTGTASQVLLAPTLTVPQMVMQGQQATISWSAIEGADSYTLQRKANTDADWTQVYSGANLSYTETVGTWTSLQYRVQAVFDGTAGGWATSDPIQIVSASALVISGQDGDLGTLVNDVPYSISSDQTSPTIDVTVEVNGGEYAAFQATSGQTYTIGVLDLPTGTGSIVITATTTVSESPVTVTRTWTYSKTAQTFPNSGSVATLTQEGNVVYPETLVEAVRASMTPWGGNLGTALELLKRAALFNRTKTPKYNEVTVDLSKLTQTDAQNGTIINLPANGVMVPHRVVHIGNPDPDLYDSSCDGVWLLREDIVGNGQWNSSNVNTLPGSTIMSTMAGYVDDYDATVQAAIKTAKIPYCVGNGSGTVNSGANGLECKMFPLGGYEVGFSQSNAPSFPIDGAKLDYFLSGTSPAANQKRIAKTNGVEAGWWLRSAYVGDSSHSIFVSDSGGWTNGGCMQSWGLLFAFLLPSTFSATYYVDTQGNLHDQQEYTEAGDWLDVWGNAIPAVKIETGSYVGTGTSGASNPNTLTFPFEPKIVFISGQSNSVNADYSTWTPMIRGARYVTTYNKGTNTYHMNVSWSNNSVSYYASSGPNFANVQLNDPNTTYYYVAIG